MKQKLIDQEMQCIFDCLDLAEASIKKRNTRHTKMLLEDALRSVKEIERMSQNETVVLVGSIVREKN